MLNTLSINSFYIICSLIYISASNYGVKMGWGGENSPLATRLSPESCPIALGTTALDRMKYAAWFSGRTNKNSDSIEGGVDLTFEIFCLSWYVFVPNLNFYGN